MFHSRFLCSVLFILFSLSANSQYCIPTYTNGPYYGVFIDGVVLNNMSNTGTGTAGTSGIFYNDYTHKFATLLPGELNEITTTSGSYTGTVYYHFWIDYNRDQDFEDAGEYLGNFTISGAYNSNSLFFSPPVVPDEPMRLRVSAVYGDPSLGPCEHITHGEVEDYTVVLPGFHDVGINITTEQDSRCFNLGDFDNNGNLDILYAANNYTNNRIELIKNNGNDVFSKSTVAVEPGLLILDVATGDYDNDGDLDFVYSSIEEFSFDNLITKAYKNNGNGTFTWDSDGGYTLKSTNNDFGDYNNDGRLDLYGSSADDDGYPMGIIYKNDENNNFVEMRDLISTEISGHSQWIDIDNDEFLDVMISGTDYNTNQMAEIYRNNEGRSFSEINIDFVFDTDGGGVFDFGDYDGDGDLDFVFEDTTVKIFKNNGDLTFTESVDALEISGSAYMYNPKWGDFDNDGDLDVFFYANGSPDAYHLFINEGNDVFTERELPEEFEFYTSDFALGDYDNDNDIDIITNEYQSGTIKIYRNDAASANTLPSVPTNIQSQATNDEVLLSWNASSDNETPAASITYNVCVGTSPGASDALDPMSHISSGARKVARRGNAGMNNKYFLKGLSPDIYYWSVQAVDGNYKGSAFSTEGTFEILPMFEELNITDSDLFGADLGDYDNDGFMDIMGDNGTTIYRNQGNFTFGSIDIQLPELLFSMFAWGDYDNDSDLDFLLVGYASFNHVAKIYRNDGGGVFTDIQAGLESNHYLDNIIGRQDIAWRDIDNDGDLDLIIAGIDSLYMFINEGDDNFIEKQTGIHHSGTDFLFIDFDSDMDLDLLIGGLEDDTTAIYENVGNGNFSVFENDLPDLGKYGHFSIGDYNNDGNADILLLGKADGLNCARIYSYEGSGVFTDIEARLQGTSGAHGALWDFDNDNYQDIIIGLGFETMFYFNENNGVFKKAEFEFPTGHTGLTSAVDLDNDGDLEILFPGKEYLYKNNMNFPKIELAAPVNLNSESVGKGIVMRWDKSPDLLSGEGASYNIRVGTSPGGADIVSPMTITPTDKRRLLPDIGNAQYNLGWRLDSMPVGDYYWSVQAISHSLCGGEWAAEESFTITALKPYFSSNVVCLGISTSFKDETIATDTEVTSWSWDFGDGSSSSQQDPGHLYDAPGEYIVTLTVTDTEGTSLEKTNPVNVLQKPQAVFNAADVCIGSMVSLLNTSVTDTLVIDSWSWDFGDGESVSVENPEPHGYFSSGSYEIKLRVDAQNGCVDSVSHITEVAEYPVTDIATGTNPEFCDGGEVKLSVPQNSNYAYQWKIGGGIISGADSSVYFANGAGDYKVHVTNLSAGCSRESLSPVSVIVVQSPTPPTILKSGATNFCADEDVELSVGYIEGYTYQWKLNEGGVGSGMNTYTANSNGNYTVEVTNLTGCSTTSANSIDIVANPVPANPTINLSGAASFCTGGSLTLSFTSENGSTYQWYNELGEIPGESGTSFTATKSGIYSVKLQNTWMCETSSQQTNVTVNEYPDKPLMTTENYVQGDCQEEEPVILSVENIEGDVNYRWLRNGNIISGAVNSSFSGYFDEGEYAVEASRDNCIALSDSIVIEYAEMLEKPEIHAEGPSVWYLACSNDSAVSYKWYLEGERIEGADGFIYVAGTQEGKFEVSIAANGSCFSKSDPLWIPLGTNMEEEIWKNLRIYPNPTPGVFTLEMDNTVMGELIIDIFGETGKQIINIKFLKEMKHFKTQIDLGGQPSGAYLINLLIDKYTANRILIVE